MGDTSLNDVTLQVGNASDRWITQRVAKSPSKFLGWNAGGVFGAYDPGAVGAVLTAFSVHNNGVDETIAAGVTQKVTFSTAEFDVGGTPPNFIFATNRFIAQSNGKYVCNAQVTIETLNGAQMIYSIMLYKNGSVFRQVDFKDYVPSASATQTLQIQAIMSLVSTDYVEVFFTNGNLADRAIKGGQTLTCFNVHSL